MFVCVHSSSVNYSAASTDIKQPDFFVLFFKWTTSGMLHPEVGFLFSASTSGDIPSSFHIAFKI